MLIEALRIRFGERSSLQGMWHFPYPRKLSPRRLLAHSLCIVWGLLNHTRSSTDAGHCFLDFPDPTEMVSLVTALITLWDGDRHWPQIEQRHAPSINPTPSLLKRTRESGFSLRLIVVRKVEPPGLGPRQLRAFPQCLHQWTGRRARRRASESSTDFVSQIKVQSFHANPMGGS
jgi:hypothetical protein